MVTLAPAGWDRSDCIADLLYMNCPQIINHQAHASADEKEEFQSENIWDKEWFQPSCMAMCYGPIYQVYQSICLMKISSASASAPWVFSTCPQDRLHGTPTCCTFFRTCCTHGCTNGSRCSAPALLRDQSNARHADEILFLIATCS